ncbi:hypothetical protein IU501_17775 [Nocardia otitidiscaviarum]|uniref:hypothetical protein n=1 Tax=Nocardia otitidiscaviarum TaxID=1823 RepID=UPI0004A775E4|nr:hypothetical protein [Nocardia otitidiscaviarum]MBF6134846.1 hypothetical protein [Nocardia otitidiscaviarum]MBF6485528.1 hypothetical protein [Nocardia otitidiscaviarum]
MSTAIVSAAVCTDQDTGSFFELASRAGRTCLEQAGVSPNRIGMVINAGVFRDSNISEPAVAALIQKRLDIGLEYVSGNVPAFSFDLMNGATGVLHAFMAAQCFLAPGEVEYAMVVAGDTHPSMIRDRDDFPYAASGAAVLLRSDTEAGGFGRPHTSEVDGSAPPTAWVDLESAGTDGRNALTVRAGTGDPLELADRVVRACLADEGIDAADFATGKAVLLAPAPVAGFRERLAYRLGIPVAALAGVDPALGDPFSAAPVHVYTQAAASGLLEGVRTVLFLGVDDSAAACLPYRPLPLSLSGSVAELQSNQVAG